MKVVNRANIDQSRFIDLEKYIPTSDSLSDVITWGLAQQPSLKIDLVVTQDEFTHDIVMSWRENLVLVFGAT